MGIVINNASFRLTNSKFLGSPPYPIEGQIFRAYSTLFDGLLYTDISGSQQTLNLSGGTAYYIVTKQNTLTDNPAGGVFGGVIVIDLFAKTTVDEVPTFTEQLITTTGAGNWTKPVGVTQVIVECWGGGGAGGGATGNPAAGAGGGGGQYSRKLITYPSAQQIIPYSVGTGGTGTTGVGGNGGDTTWNTSQVIAKGGTGGQANAITVGIFVDGGLGDVAGSVGDVIYSGSVGSVGQIQSIGGPFGGYGGPAAGSAETNINGPGGVGGRELGGAGGSFLENVTSNGNPGSTYGGGGGGGCTVANTDVTGGNGAQGLIRLTYR